MGIDKNIRFFKYVNKTKCCWEWVGGKYYNGYGQFYENPNKICAHRFSYKIHKGEIPRGKLVLHKCDNRSCVNPKHLVLGTQKDNIHDMIKKGRRIKSSRVGENNGRCKISEKIAKIIRKRYANEKISAKNLGNEYGISESQTLRIINGESWTHI